MVPAFPPSSSTTFFFPASFFIFQPTSGEPVKERSLILSSVTNKLPTFLSIGRIDTAPLGRDVWLIMFASSKVDNGVVEDGLRIIGQLDAIAGAILCTARFIGKLKGEIPATTPMGKYFTNPSLFFPLGSQSSRMYSIGGLLVSSAAAIKVYIARLISLTAYFIMC